MPYGARILKNGAWLMGATAGQKIIAFIAFTLVARLIGRDLTGVFFYSISITSIFVILSDLGITPVVIRAVAGNREDGSRLLGAAIKAKLLLSPVAIAAALIYAVGFGADRTILATVAIACLVMTADTFHLVIYGAIRGKQNLRPEAIGMFVGQVLTGAVSVAAAWFGYGPIGLATALLVGSAWNVLWSLSRMKALGVTTASPSRRDYRQLVHEAIPFALAGGAVKVYSYVDSLFLKQFHGTSAVGLYAVAYKLTYALQFLPITFTAALYPALAAAYANREKDEVKATFVGSLRLMAAIGFPISAGLSALAPRIIPLLYGEEFLGAIPVFRVLPWVLLPIFLDFPIGALLNATNRAGKKTTAMLIVMFVNVAANALLIPSYGALGAAWAGVVSFWGLYLIGAWFTRKDAGGTLMFVSLTLRALVAAVVCWIAWRTVGDLMAFPAAIVFGAAVAVVMMFLMRFVTVNDVFEFIRKFRPAPQKIDSIHE